MNGRFCASTRFDQSWACIQLSQLSVQLLIMMVYATGQRGTGYDASLHYLFFAGVDQ